jgi:YVTN family beta-propeller protein
VVTTHELRALSAETGPACWRLAWHVKEEDSRPGRRRRARLLALGAFALLALLALPASALARTAFVANGLSNSVTPIDTATNTAGTAIGVGE